jgi:hypothetical protein
MLVEPEDGSEVDEVDLLGSIDPNHVSSFPSPRHVLDRTSVGISLLCLAWSRDAGPPTAVRLAVEETERSTS